MVPRSRPYLENTDKKKFFILVVGVDIASEGLCTIAEQTIRDDNGLEVGLDRESVRNTDFVLNSIPCSSQGCQSCPCRKRRRPGCR